MSQSSAVVPEKALRHVEAHRIASFETRRPRHRIPGTVTDPSVASRAGGMFLDELTAAESRRYFSGEWLGPRVLTRRGRR